MRFLTARDDALLVEVDALEQVVALHASLLADPVPGVGQTVPGARALLVPFDPWRVRGRDLAAILRERVLEGAAAAVGPEAGRLVEIPTVYDGADLADVAALLGWSEAEVVRRHAAASWVVGFVGFAPGFAYLLGDDGGLAVPRRPSPRTRVPAGAVALAGPYSGVYPRESPGGWQLVGRTDVVTWDPEREPPTPWAPGDRVRFLPARAVVDLSGSSSSDRQSELPPRSRTADLIAGAALEVLAPGPQALVQDLGRPGMAHLGVSASGAADPRSLRAANRAVGNDLGAAAVEATGGGLRLRARGRVVMALAGADARAVVHPRGEDDARPAPLARPFGLDDGDELVLGAPVRGWRTYVALRGGVDVPPVLGSRATDALAHLGPPPLAPTTRLRPAPGGTAGGAVALDDVGAPDAGALPAPGEVTTLPVVLGPHDDWFDADAVARLRDQEWEVTARADRVGLRLDGARPLERAPSARGRELPSEGCVTGALQVPPDGRPMLFGVDHPLTGGYPVIAAVPSSHTWLLGQLPPGARLRFAV